MKLKAEGVGSHILLGVTTVLLVLTAVLHAVLQAR